MRAACFPEKAKNWREVGSTDASKSNLAGKGKAMRNLLKAEWGNTLFLSFCKIWLTKPENLFKM